MKIRHLLHLCVLTVTVSSISAQNLPVYPANTSNQVAVAPGALPAGPPAGYIPAPGSNPYASQAQPGYQQPRQAPAPLVDDNGSVAAVINSMDKLDDTRRLQIGDHIAFRVVEDRSPLKTLRIIDSGEVQVPYIGLVTAKDLTCKQVAYIVKAELEKEYFNEATVIVALDSSWRMRGHGANPNNPYPGFGPEGMGSHVVIFGQVQRQGRMPIPDDGSVTISTAILQAGGFARFGNQKRVRIYRKIPGNDKERRVIIVDVSAIMKRGHLHKDIPLKADDVIIVPEKNH